MKGFVFSLDAVVSLLLIASFSVFAIAFMQSFPFSQISGVETALQTSTALQAMRAKGDLDRAVSYAVNGNTLQAQTLLRNALSTLFKSKHKKQLTIKVYDSSMNPIVTIQARSPSSARPLKDSTVSSNVQTFVSGDYYAIVYLQVWE